MAENNDIIKDKIRERLITLRSRHFLTQTQEGDIVGESKTAVASWEQGLSIPDPVTLKKLALYYGKTMDYMYGDSEE